MSEEQVVLLCLHKKGADRWGMRNIRKTESSDGGHERGEYKGQPDGEQAGKDAARSPVELPTQPLRADRFDLLACLSKVQAQVPKSNNNEGKLVSYLFPPSILIKKTIQLIFLFSAVYRS